MSITNAHFFNVHFSQKHYTTIFLSAHHCPALCATQERCLQLRETSRYLIVQGES